MEGLDLLRLLIQSTGLPHSAVEKELTRILNAHGFQKESLTLDQIRDVLAIYLQDVLIESKNSISAPDLIT